MVILTLNMPLTEPVAVFAVLITAIFLSPFIFRLLKIPDVAAFIITGIIIGPLGLNILGRDSSIELLGTAGLLYIMFLIGLELDPDKLRTSKRQSIVFGLFTFSFPFLLGIIASKYLLKQDLSSSLFVALMFSSHTLVAYPVVRKLGVTGDLAVVTAIGGTIITDTLVLVLLSFLVQGNTGLPFPAHLVRTILPFGVYLLVIFYGYPRIARWFFANVKRDRPVHFLFLMLMVSISSVMAILIGFEAIIGAFVAGMALSRSVPRNSLLMHHVDFVGNILFIPVFLIGTGMLINIRVLFTEPALWLTFLILFLGAMAGKWLAAYFTQKSMGMSLNQRNLLFGLSGSRAAAAIAVMLLGFERNLIDEHLLDATVLIILGSCLAGSFLTDRYGKRMVLTGMLGTDAKLTDIILVPISNPSHMAQLVTLALKLQDRMSPSPVYLLSIVQDDKNTRENITRIRSLLEANVSEFNDLNESVKVITRVDMNVSSGILRTAKEYLVSDIIIGWGGRTSASSKIFGSVFDQLYNGFHTMYVCNLTEPPEDTEKMVILIPSNLEYEVSYSLIVERISRLPIRSGGTVEIHAPHAAIPDALRFSQSRKRNIEILHRPMAPNADVSLTAASKKMHVIILPRKQTVSYHAGYDGSIRRQILSIEQGSFILIVPGFEY